MAGAGMVEVVVQNRSCAVLLSVEIPKRGRLHFPESEKNVLVGFGHWASSSPMRVSNTPSRWMILLGLCVLSAVTA